jgi:hypothetical protein
MKIRIDSAVDLLHATPHAVMATHSTSLPGFPYATAVPLVVDAQHRPLLLISALAEHTKNLVGDPRASLEVHEHGPAAIQNSARMTLVGNFVRFDPAPDLVARYLRYQPDAQEYLALDFMFFRLNVQRTRFIGGVGKMGWLEKGDWNELRGIAAEDEARLLAQAETQLPPGVTILGIDAYGIDFADAGTRQRRQFESPLSADELAQHLPELLRTLTP